ncbi:MAG: hypothetical protein LUG46_00220 [Erysipelotrichaceae bacterium]|nr:hypothetical protein [Erysipelotrichaceae bacterium]
MKFEYERTPNEEFKLGMEISSVWDTLQSKSEYLSAASEKGYQSIAASAARRIAHILKVDADLSETLTMCKGSYFPINGKAGKKCMMEYLDEKGISVSEAKLGTDFIKYHLNRRKEAVTSEIEVMLMELFDDEKEADIIEVKIAKFCHQAIEDIKKVQKSGKKYEGNLLYDVTEDIIDQCDKTKKLEYGSLLLKLLDGVEDKEVELSKEEHDRLYKLLDKFMNEFQENGIYNFIACPDVSIR